MIQLIKNVHVFRQGAWQPSEILIAGNKIEQIADQISMEYDGLTVIDGRGMRAIPGYIDQHVHVTGGGGEGSFITQVPPMKFSEPIKAGVTTIVGLLGTDGTTRSVASLVARTKALRKFGLTAYCLTGNYHYPSPTLTGSVMDDIVFIDEIIGVKIAIADHRSSNMTREDLIRLASDARVAGMLSGKPGIVHLHTGSGREELDMLFPHQANLRIITSAAKRLKLPMEKVWVNVDKYANTSAASIPIALCEAQAAGKLKKGDNIILDGFGAGLTWAAIVLKWSK